jgi:hypothetical protein
MKITTSTTKIIFFTLLIIAVVIGGYIAYATLYRYELLVKGALSFTALYFIYRQCFQIEFPKSQVAYILSSRGI